MSMMSQGRWVLPCVLALMAGCSGSEGGPGAPARLGFIGEPIATATSVASLGAVRVSVLGANGGLVTDAGDRSVTVTLSSTDTAAHLAGTTTAPVIGGMATFADLVVAHAGTGYRLIARATGLDSAVSRSFDVAVSVPTGLRFGNASAAPIVAGADLNATVLVVDAGGNVIPNATNTITVGYTVTLPFGISQAEGGLFGTRILAAVNGVARFPGLSFHRTGMYQLVALSPGLTSGTRDVTISNGPIVRLMFYGPMYDVDVGSVMGSVDVLQSDDFGNGLTPPLPAPAPYTVSLAIGNNPGQGALHGTTSAQDQTGFAPVTFRDLTIDKAGVGYTLVATSNGRTVTSAPFNVR